MNNNRNSSIKFKGNRKNEKCADIAKKKNGIFWVRQGVESSNCRLNALNAFFGYEKLSIIIFERDAAAFDAQFNCSGSKDFTSFGIRTDGILECVVSFVVAKDKEFRCEIYLANQDWDGDASDDLEAIFVFDRDHMWLEKFIENSWFVIDSRSNGPKKIKKPGNHVNNGRIYVFRQERMEENEIKQKSPKKGKKIRLKNNVVPKQKRQNDPEELTIVM